MTAPVSVDDALACDVVLAIVGSAGQVGTASATMPPPPGHPPRTDPYLRAVQAVVEDLLALGSSVLSPGMFGLGRHRGRTIVVAADAAGLLYGLHALVRRGEATFSAPDDFLWDLPVNGIRMLDHWDNVDVHPVMGQVERGYAGGSIFWDDGRVRDDLSRVAQYARLLGVGRDQRGRAQQRQRARGRGAAAHRPPRRRRRGSPTCSGRTASACTCR